MPKNIHKIYTGPESDLAAAEWLRLMRTKSNAFWTRLEKKIRSQLFIKLTRNVPAYRAFLRTESYNKSIVRLNEATLPAVNKKNYFAKYKSRDLAPAIKQAKPTTITATSGSTGTPTYFYRNEWLDFTYSVYLETFLAPYKTKRMLFIDCFGMGVWIGGLLTFTALRTTTGRGFMADIITPGVSLKDIFASLHNLATSDNYDSVILAGYPPFIKDILDSQDFPTRLRRNGKLRFIFAAESFTEGFRDYIVKKACVKNKYIDTMNIYGSAELGAMAIETPLTILCRELISRNKKLSSIFFPSGKIPTIAQYNPAFCSFFEREGRLLVSGDSITPFLHYDIGDSGKVFSFTAMQTIFKETGIDLTAEGKKAGVRVTEMPFVLVYERADLSSSIYGLQIYPQHIKQGLERYVNQGILTGKFTLSTKLDRKKNQFLEIKVEAATDTVKLPKEIASHIRDTLLAINSEYRELSKYLSAARLTPRIITCKKGDPVYFPVGIKQKWVQRS